MSTTLNISFISKNAPELLFEKLYGQILLRGNFSKTFCYEEHFFGNQSEIEQERLTIEKVSNIFDSNLMFEIQFNYRLESYHEIPISLFVIGNRFESGSEVNESSNLKIQFSLKDLVGTTSYKDKLDETERLKFGRRVINDSDSIFLALCGYDMSKESSFPEVKEASMYMEAGWPSPVCQAMIYHSNIRELKFDFIRIYNEYFFSENPILNLKKNSIPKIITDQKNRSNKKIQYYNQFDSSGEGELISFLEELDPSIIKGICNLSASEIVEIIHRCSPQVNEVQIIEVEMAGESGVFLLSNPRGSLWRFYFAFYDSYKNSRPC